MARVSKKYIRETKLIRIYDLFFEVIVNIRNKKCAEKILSEILTPPEKIMLAKRITCIYLLLKEIPLIEIAEAIKMSRSTVFYFKEKYEQAKETKEILSTVLAKEEIKNFFEDIFVEFKTIPGKGTNWRQQRWDKLQHKWKRQEPI